ncbi:methionyl-tRNA formyltransferase [Formivibrio citricus]|uniref:Methionyl-tRNA formyltransferase n=1 Tax=Formivibrio citricus TaxID=83765 RepID=A0A1I4VB15_9NEIS|nr:formyltransferase family protein [Formivibrio citricus]SFM98391.1 methionyl-tRNA formyltransferase [Formivibrio citricus]
MHRYQVDVLCTDPRHPVRPLLESWRARQAAHDIAILGHSSQLRGGDFLFLVSCQEIIRAEIRNRYRYALVLHASPLPQGRGMSPHIWQVLEGKREITLTMLNAEDALDSGDIWVQQVFCLEGHELADEINAKLFDCEIALMDWALENCESSSPRTQSGEGSFYRRRTPEDSRIDPEKSLADQFNLLRVADPERYPAFFDWQGHRYHIVLKKAEEK